MIITTQVVIAQDNEDHPLLSRFAGSELIAANSIDYYAVRLPAGPINDEDIPDNILELEGKITWLSYDSPENKSELEIVRNYEAALNEGGFDIIFSCTGSECGQMNRMYGWLFSTTFNRKAEPVFREQSHTRPANYNDQSRLLLASRSDKAGLAHILVYIGEHSFRRNSNRGIRYIGHVVVEGEPMQTGQVEAGVRSASELHSSLDQDGRVVVPGIFFDFDSAALRPESHEAVEQMAELMRSAPGLRVHIVGHTDNQGSFDYNLNLSERRAQAVLQALVNDYGIEAERMVANGVASLAPVTSNTTEQGREQNRRVELVLQ